MTPEDSFADLMARLRNGDDDAAARVLHRFTHRLIALARLHLDSRVRQKVDPEDVLQSVYKSFFLRQAAGEFDLGGWDGMWALLTVITLRKCGRVNRYFRSARRNAGAEVPLHPSEEPGAWQVLASDPTPKEAVLLAELVEGLLRDLGQRDGAILTLALQGHGADEISDRLDRPRRTVSRVLQRIKDRLQRTHQDEFPSP